MPQPYQKLFNTIQEISAAGKVRLSADERAIIERETRDLINKSQAKNYRFASSVPQGFDALLEKLRSADAEEAYSLVKNFMDDEGDAPDKPKETEESVGKDLDDLMDDEGDKPNFGGGDKPDFGKGDDDDEHEEHEHEEKEEHEEKSESDDKGKSEKSEKKDDKGDKSEKSEKKDFPFDKKDDEKAIPDKAEVLARIKKRRAQDMDKKPMDKKPMDKKPDDKSMDKGDGPKLDEKGPHGPHGQGKDKMKNLKDDHDEKDKRPSMNEMGIEDKDVDPTISLRAKKVRVKVTAERNVIAYHEDHGPVFVLTPSNRIKGNKAAMTRLANRAYGLSVYEGFVSAANKLGAKMLHTAGVDDDVETVTQEEPETPVNEGVLDDAETVTVDEVPEEKSVGDDTQTDADDDMEQEPAKIARYKRLTKKSRPRRAADGDISDGVDTVTQEMPESLPSKVTEGEDDVAEEAMDNPNDNVLAEEQVDFKTAKKIEADYRKLYASRLKKAEENFVRKFSRCMRIASKRMLLNHAENPWKVAAADVLMSEDIELDNGDQFKPMPEGIAVQITELISTEGQPEFVHSLMDDTADLMEKSDEYLEDVESDISKLKPIAVDVSPAPPKRQARANTMRRAASSGNFGLMDKASSARPSNSQDSLRTAMHGSDTRVNRDLGRLRK